MEDKQAPFNPGENSIHPSSREPAGEVEPPSHKSEDDVILLTHAPVGSGSSGTAAITPDQLEAALERVIRKLFSGKIDGMIIDVIDQAVSREIDRIKTLILTTDRAEEKEP